MSSTTNSKNFLQSRTFFWGLLTNDFIQTTIRARMKTIGLHSIGEYLFTSTLLSCSILCNHVKIDIFHWWVKIQNLDFDFELRSRIHSESDQRFVIIVSLSHTRTRTHHHTSSASFTQLQTFNTAVLRNANIESYLVLYLHCQTTMSSNLRESSNQPQSNASSQHQQQSTSTSQSSSKHDDQQQQQHKSGSPHVDVNEILELDPLARTINEKIAPVKQLSMTQQEQLRTYIEDKNACNTGLTWNIQMRWNEIAKKQRSEKWIVLGIIEQVDFVWILYDPTKITSLDQFVNCSDCIFVSRDADKINFLWNLLYS